MNQSGEPPQWKEEEDTSLPIGRWGCNQEANRGGHLNWHTDDDDDGKRIAV